MKSAGDSRRGQPQESGTGVPSESKRACRAWSLENTFVLEITDATNCQSEC